jgi:hypothetical protein
MVGKSMGFADGWVWVMGYCGPMGYYGMQFPAIQAGGQLELWVLRGYGFLEVWVKRSSTTVVFHWHAATTSKMMHDKWRGPKNFEPKSSAPIDHHRSTSALSSSSDLTMAACAAILSLSLAPLSPPEPISHIDGIPRSLLMQEDIYYSWSNEESSKRLYRQQEASFFGIGKCKGTTCRSESEKN